MLQILIIIAGILSGLFYFIITAYSVILIFPRLGFQIAKLNLKKDEMPGCSIVIGGCMIFLFFFMLPIRIVKVTDIASWFVCIISIIYLSRCLFGILENLFKAILDTIKSKILKSENKLIDELKDRAKNVRNAFLSILAYLFSNFILWKLSHPITLEIPNKISRLIDLAMFLLEKGG